MTTHDPLHIAAPALSCDHAGAARAVEHHHDIELLLVERGRASLCFGKERVVLRAGDLALRWGLIRMALS